MADDLETQTNGSTLELAVMTDVAVALGRLPSPAARQRVLSWAAGAFSVPAGQGHPLTPTPAPGMPHPETVGTLAELLDRAEPGNRQERILTVAYWLQVEQAQAEWTSQAVNDLLKDLGEGVPNITDALAGLAQRRPSLVRQLRKSGRTQQARKKYNLTEAGRQAVRDLIRAKEERRG